VSHVTLLDMAISDSEILEVWFFAVCCSGMIDPAAKVSEELNKKCCPRNAMVQEAYSVSSVSKNGIQCITNDVESTRLVK